MPRWKKGLYALFGLLVLSMLTVALVVPDILRGQAIRWVATHTSRTLQIDRVALNPLTWGVRLEGVALSQHESDAGFFTFDRLTFHISPRSLYELAPVISDLELVNPRLTVTRDADGRFSFSDLTSVNPETSPPPPETAQPARFAVNNLVVRGGAAEFTDLSRPGTTHRISELEVALPFIGNTPALADRFVEPRLSLRVDDAPFAATGETKPFSETLASTLQLKIDAIDIPYYVGYLPKDLGFAVSSGHLSLDVTLGYQIRAGNLPELTLKGDVIVTGLDLRDGAGNLLVRLPLTQAHVDSADLFAGRLSVGTVALYKPELFVERDKTGRLNLLQLVPPSQPATTSPAPPANPPAISLDQLRLRDGRIHVLDAGGRTPLRRELSEINLNLGPLDLRSNTSIPGHLELIVADPVTNRTGSVTLDGTLGLVPVQAEGHLNFRQLPLTGLEAYFPSRLSAEVRQGHADGDLDFTFAGGDAEPRLTVRGEAGIRTLQVYEPATQSDILSWESLQLAGIDLRLADGEPHLRLAEVVLNGFLARIMVTAAGKVNLQQAISAEAATPAPAAPEEAESPRAPPDVRIDSVVLQEGQVAFLDQHLAKPYVSNLSNLGGRISNLEAGAPEPASLDLRGRLDNLSPLRIDGRINPFGAGLFADLKIRFDAIDLAPMTPYSGTYLGYAIEKGKLFLDLDYRIDGDKLRAGNKVFVDQFTFGEKVESDQATGLPVRLAVALLKDRKGEIHLDLPVRGSLDDPQFSVVGVLFDILKNLLIKAATSPFALLASIVGGGEDFDSIAFAPGATELAPDEQGKLDQLVAALAERPGLKLDVSGYVDIERDPEGYRRLELERRILAAAGAKTPLSPELRSKALGRVYRQADFPKPRNFLGLVKSLPDAEMEKLLLAHTPAGEAQMQLLAQERAKAVAAYLTAEGRLPSGRVFLKQDDIRRAPESDRPGSRVGFGIGID